MSRRATDAIPVVPGFKIEEEIGRGTSARVFRARQEKLNRLVALKVITTLGEEGNRRALRLFREASLTGGLDHPGIVRAIDAGDRDDFCWFAMELVEGRTLQQSLDEAGPWPWKKAVVLGLEVLDALSYAHSRGVVHRDLKPSNILIDLEGHARILDLGLARREADPRLTHEGGTVGTPRFMAPEQALDPGKIDGRADLFALGAVLYRTMSGIGPFDAETVAAVLTRLLYDDPTPLSMLNSDLPEAVSLVIGKVLEKDPDHRFKDATEFANALRAAARGLRPKATRSRNRTAWIVAAAAIPLVLGVAGFLMFRPNPSAPDPDPVKPRTEAAPPVVRYKLRDLIPPAQAQLQPLDRARLAIAAFETDPSTDRSGELAAAMKPLRDELTNAASQHKSAARSELLSKGVADARRTMGTLADRLRADISPGDEPIPPALESMVQEVTRAATEAFASELKTEQDDVANDIERELEALVASPEARHWSSGEQTDRVARVLSRKINSLEGELLARVSRKRDEVQIRLASIPVTASKDALDRARALVRDGHFKAARAVLATVTGAAAEGSAPGASVEAQPVLLAIEAGENKLIAEAEASVERVNRSGTAPLGPAERTLRATNLATIVETLNRSLEDVPQIKDPLGLAAAVSKVATEAAGLRDATLERLGAGAPDAGTIDWKVRRKGSVGARSLVKREGRKIEVRREDGAPESWDVEDVTAQTVAEALKALGGKPGPIAIALLEFWDGEADSAQVRLRALKGDPVRDRLLGIVEASIEESASSYPTEAEREAFPVFLQARRKFAEGSYARTLELVEPLMSQKRLAGTSFLRQHQAELETMVTQSRHFVVRATRLRPFGPAAEVKDEKAGVVRILWAFDQHASTDGLLLPQGASLEAEGLKWPGTAGDRAALPEQSPALRILFPEGTAASPANIELELRRSPEAVAFVAMSFGGVSMLVLGDLKQSNAFAGMPLHGLEKDLVTVQSVQKGVVVMGSILEARRVVQQLGKPAALNRADSTIVRLRIDSQSGEILGQVGNERIPLSGDRRALDEPPALDLRLPPGIVIRSLVVELPLVPKKAG